MFEKIQNAAIKLFGKRRFAELMGQLWLDREKIEARVGGQDLDLYPVLLEWENRFKRDVEEGRYRVGRNRRYRVMRFSEIEAGGRHLAAEIPLTISDNIRETF